MESGYNKTMMRKQILNTREYSRNDLLEREKQQMSEKKLIFNISYHTSFQNVNNGGIMGIMEELHMLLTPNKKQKLFPVFAAGFNNEKNDIIMIAVLYLLDIISYFHCCYSTEVNYHFLHH